MMPENRFERRWWWRRKKVLFQEKFLGSNTMLIAVNSLPR
jgi:hypothetical protein